MFPNVLTEPPSRFKIGFPSDFPPGVVDEKFKAQFGIWLVNVEYKGQRQIVALKTVCTHLGCTPNWLEGEQNSNAPATAAGFIRTASISKVRRRGRSSGMRFVWPTTVNWKSTRAERFRKSWVSGATLLLCAGLSGWLSSAIRGCGAVVRADGVVGGVRWTRSSSAACSFRQCGLR